METGRWNYEDLNPDLEQNKFEFKYTFGNQNNKASNWMENDEEVEKEIQTSFEKYENSI